MGGRVGRLGRVLRSLGGRASIALCLLVFLGVLSVPLRAAEAPPEESTPATVCLPFANFDESGGRWLTTETRINVTDEAITLPADFIGSRTYPPHSVVRTPDWPTIGGGVECVDVEPGFLVYAGIKAPNGVIARVEDIGPARENAWIYDLPAGEDWRVFLFVFSPTGGIVNVIQHSDDASTSTALELRPGETKVIPAAAGNVELVADSTWASFLGEGLFQAFGIASRQPDGEMFVIPAR